MFGIDAVYFFLYPVGGFSDLAECLHCTGVAMPRYQASLCQKLIWQTSFHFYLTVTGVQGIFEGHHLSISGILAVKSNFVQQYLSLL